MKLSLAIPALLISIVAGEGGLRAVQPKPRNLYQIQNTINGERRLMTITEYLNEADFLAAIVDLTTTPNANPVIGEPNQIGDRLWGSTCKLFKEEFGDGSETCPSGDARQGCGALTTGTGLEFENLTWETNTNQVGEGPGPSFDTSIRGGKFFDQVDRDHGDATWFRYPALEAWGAKFNLGDLGIGHGLSLEVYCEDQMCGQIDETDIGTRGYVFRGYIAEAPIANIKIQAGQRAGNMETYRMDDFWIFPWCSPVRNGIKGDPHIETWTGEYFDFMGQCDLVYLEDEEQDIDIHARTTIRYDYSYVESAAVRIGNDIIEVSSFGEHSVNGVDGVFLAGAPQEEPVTLGGHPVYYTGNKRNHKFDIVLGNEKNITLGAFKDLVYATVKGDESVSGFEKSKGIMGNVYGHLLGRDGTTEYKIKDQASMDAFGQEWQVGPQDRKLFRTDRAPQYPAKCTFPSKDVKDHRKLAESPVELNAAERACARFAGDTFQKCVYDVMAYGDLEVATSGMY